jgi:hypothetical protein
LAEDVLGQAFAVVVLAVYIWRAVTLLPPPTALFSVHVLSTRTSPPGI